jgi:RHH-type transcriptional regulator, rel operon repressor / antitoxin RelB
VNVTFHNAAYARPSTGLKNSPRLPGRSSSFLAAAAISEYLDVNETQVSGIKDAIASLDRGEAVSHEKVREWVLFWDIRPDVF